MIDQAKQFCGLPSYRVAQLLETGRYRRAVEEVKLNTIVDAKKARKIIQLRALGMKMGAIATEVGVGKTTIWKVIQAHSR
jgi:hypothetical protein